MNSVLTKITQWFCLIGLLALAAFVVGVDYHVLWIGEWRGAYFDAVNWELWKKVLIFIAEIIVFIGCCIACYYLFTEAMCDDIEASVGNFFKGLLALICCGVIPGILWWITMIQSAISQSIYSSRGYRSSSPKTSSSDDDDESDGDDDSNDEEEEKPKTRRIKFRQEDADEDDDSSSPTPRRVLKRKGA